MYTDPNTIGMSLQTFAALLVVIIGTLLFLSKQTRTRLARIRLRARNPKQETNSTQDERSDG